MGIADCTSHLSSRFQAQFSRFFWWLGIKIHRRPWLFILIGALMTLGCAVGFMFFNSENRGTRLWIPQETEPYKQYQIIRNNFGSYPAPLLLLLTAKDDSESILSPENLNIIYEIFDDVNLIELEFLGQTYSYDDLCLRPYPLSSVCSSALTNIFGFYFQDNSELWQNNSNVLDAINANNAINGFAGGFETDDAGYIHGANALIIQWMLKGSTNQTVEDILYEFEKSFTDYWEIHHNDYGEINIQYLTQRAYSDEVSRVVSGDIPVYLAALVTMLLYLMLTLGDFSCVGARPWLALSAMIVMVAAMITGFGIAFIGGATFNTMVTLSAYILLGIGVDDMIILVDTYNRTKISDTIPNQELRLAKALSLSGLSISLTSFCSSMAFFVGSSTDLPSISAFCTFAAWSFLANYVLQFLIFVPLMVYDDRRIRKQNNFCCPCIINHQSDDEQMKEMHMQTKNCKDKCKMAYFMQLCLIPMLSKRICRWIIILMFLSFVGFSTFAAFNITVESDDKNLMPDDSFILDYLEVATDNFGENNIHNLVIILKDEDFSHKYVRDNIYEFFNELESEPDAIGKVEQWLTPFTQWIIDNDNGTTINDLSGAMFYQYLQQFANDTIHSEWDSEIIYDSNEHPTNIKLARFILTAFRVADDTENYDEYLHWNDICHSYFGSNAFIYEIQHGFSYLAANILRMTLQNMIFAGLGVFGVLFLLLDLRMAVFILIVVAMIDVDLFGWMYLWDISLDVVSYSELVMAVGLTVDYVIHITHAIADEMTGLPKINDDIYAEKLKIAMGDMGSSVLKGSFTTFLGVVALAFSQSQAFRIFFLMFLGIIVIAVMHGVILVPALLGEFKFIYKGSRHETDKLALETHNNLTENNNIEMSEYNGDENENKNSVMTAILSLKKHNPELEKKLDDIMVGVNNLLKENDELRNNYSGNKKAQEKMFTETDTENEDQTEKDSEKQNTDLVQEESAKFKE